MTAVSLARINHDALLELPPETTQIITVNNRFARRVLSFFQQHLKADQQAMAIAEVLPLSAWWRRCEEDLIINAQQMPAAYVLDNFSSVQVWEEVIRRCDADERPLIDSVQAAKLAYEADRLLDEWEISVQDLEQNLDHERFLVWRQAYEEYLQQHDLDDDNRSMNRIIAALKQGVMSCTAQHIVWVGFHEFSPRLKRLQQILSHYGVRQYILSWSAVPAQEKWQVQAESAEHEWRLAAQWAQEQLTQNPHGRYAIVAVELEKYAPFARRVLDHYFDGRWNMAVGRPLSEWPQVRQLLAWLEVLKVWQQAWRYHPEQPMVAPELLGPALLSGPAGPLGWVGPRLDVHWRQTEVMELSLRDWQQALAQHAPAFFERWQEVWAQIKAAPKLDTADGWVGRMRQWLATLGLPGQKYIDSVTYQVLQAFEERFLQCAQYGLALGEMSFAHAVHVFKRLCQEVLFQPERDPEARLDVLGMLEAEGGRWDAVWVLGLTDQVFPAAPKPNPFIPFSALARHHAPRSTPEREFEWAKISFEQLLCSAPQIWLSAPMFDGEEALRPSPLISDCVIQSRCVSAQTLMPFALEQIEDKQAPAVQLQQEPLHGGASLLEIFARNQQWAFVRFRLQAQKLVDYASISRSHVLGSVIHRALEQLWRTLPEPSLKGVQQWLASPYAERTLAAIIEQLKLELLSGFPSAIQDLIGHWTQQVVWQWMHVEAQRNESFHCVAAEQQAQFHIGELVLNLRIDRIDELADGRLLLIDYKSSRSAKLPVNEWLRPQPIELQLPLYASLLQAQQRTVAGLAIAKVSADKVGFDGIGEQVAEHGFKEYAHDTLDWDAQLAQWQQYIEQLGQQLLAGAAHNIIHDPKDYEHCDALPFLRITKRGEYYEQ